MKTIKVTFIDNCSHGYYSVSKKDIQRLGIKPEEISGYSGHTFNRVYLEEHCDATVFFNKAKEKGIEVIVKDGYNPNFQISHNYNPELFDYSPKVNDVINLGEEKYKIISFNKKTIFVRQESTGKMYGITMANPFKYIERVETI